MSSRPSAGVSPALASAPAAAIATPRLDARPAISRRDWVLRGLAAGLTGAATGSLGCRLQKPALPQRTFLLRAPSADPARAVPEPPGGVLLVRPVRVAAAFDSRAFVVRRGEAEYTTDPYHAFLLSPGPMFTDALADWLRGLGVFRDVTTGGSQLAPTHALEAEVMELYADYRSMEGARAVLVVQFRYLHPLIGAQAPVLWQRQERQSIPLPRAGVEELVTGWSEALAAVCRTLEPSLFSPAPTLLPAQPQA